jgi:phospholipase A1
MEGLRRLNTTPSAWQAWLLAGSCALSLPAAAATAQDCLVIEADAARLACFDRLHGRTPAPPAPPASTGQPVPAPVPPAAAAGPPTAPASMQTGSTRVRVRDRGPLARAWALDGAAQGFRLWPHRPIYVLPVSFTDNINRRPSSPAPGHDVGIDLPNRDLEAKFQISAKTLAWRGVFGDAGDLWVGYTQSSRWQVYQGDISRPFRETNHEPELILNFDTDFEWFGWRGRVLGLALNHQSNGRALPLSRSWNRVIGHIGFERGAWSLLLRPWVRIGEPAEQDDNPDIEDHIGRADLTLRHEAAGGHDLSLRLRHTLRGGERSRGSAELEWAFPLSGRLHGFVQAFSGYGESLIDYNIRQHRIGLGFSLAGWH